MAVGMPACICGASAVFSVCGPPLCFILAHAQARQQCGKPDAIFDMISAPRRCTEVVLPPDHACLRMPMGTLVLVVSTTPASQPAVCPLCWLPRQLVYAIHARTLSYGLKHQPTHAAHMHLPNRGCLDHSNHSKDKPARACGDRVAICNRSDATRCCDISITAPDNATSGVLNHGIALITNACQVASLIRRVCVTQ
jgi:hypothetical protein